MTELGYEGKHESQTPNNCIVPPSLVLSRGSLRVGQLKSQQQGLIKEPLTRVCVSAVYILLMVCRIPTLISEPSKCPHIQMNTSYSHLTVCFLHNILRNSLWCSLMDLIPFFRIVQITY